MERRMDGGITLGLFSFIKKVGKRVASTVSTVKRKLKLGFAKAKTWTRKTIANIRSGVSSSINKVRKAITPDFEPEEVEVFDFDDDAGMLEEELELSYLWPSDEGDDDIDPVNWDEYDVDE
jgi:DNA relaxase NicK